MDGGWTHIGETDGPIRFETAARALDDAREALRLPGPISGTFTITDPAAVAVLYRTIHDIDLGHCPRRHGHCPTCHPEQDRRPLAVNGHEYNRRRKARMRKRRRIA